MQSKFNSRHWKELKTIVFPFNAITTFRDDYSIILMISVPQFWKFEKTRFPLLRWGSVEASDEWVEESMDDSVV